MKTKRFCLLQLFIFSAVLLTNCNGQSGNSTQERSTTQTGGLIGGPFENSEFFFMGMPEHINATDTSPGWSQAGQKLLITGTIYKKDGKTPAPGVILYYYHTDVGGEYSNREGLDPRVRRHGYIRGWVKSDAEGRYAIYTVRPGIYPNRAAPAHIHPAIKEPGIEQQYYIDEFVFDDDPLLTTEYRSQAENRGGSGVLRVKQQGDLQVAEHNIILGLHVPNYPEKDKAGMQSGRSIGEDVFSFTPYHAWGPDKGTKTCPICKYGKYTGVLYFAGTGEKDESMQRWLSFLEGENNRRAGSLKTFLIASSEKEEHTSLKRNLEETGRILHLKKTALAIVPSFSDKPSDVYLNKINPAAANTVIVYHNSNIIDKYINLEPSPENFALLAETFAKEQGNFFK